MDGLLSCAQLLGPQQLRYMTVLRDSSDCWKRLAEGTAEESFLA